MGLAVVLVTIVALAILFPTHFRSFDQWNGAVVRRFASLRVGWLTSPARLVNAILASRWTIRLLRLGTIAALVRLRRWRRSPSRWLE